MLELRVLTAVTVKSIIILDVTTCNPVKFTGISEECTAFIFRVEE
jgi:hypothetical protein